MDPPKLLILGIPEVSHLGIKQTERGANYSPSLVPKIKYTFTKTPNLTVGCRGQLYPRKDVTCAGFVVAFLG